jgi:hypothetical protein
LFYNFPWFSWPTKMSTFSNENHVTQSVAKTKTASWSLIVLLSTELSRTWCIRQYIQMYRKWTKVFACFQFSLSHIFTDEPGNAKSPYQPCIFGIRRSTTIKFKVISREYLPIWTIHFLIKILSLFQWNTLMIFPTFFLRTDMVLMLT